MTISLVDYRNDTVHRRKIMILFLEYDRYFNDRQEGYTDDEIDYIRFIHDTIKEEIDIMTCKEFKKIVMKGLQVMKKTHSSILKQ